MYIIKDSTRKDFFLILKTDKWLGKASEPSFNSSHSNISSRSPREIASLANLEIDKYKWDASNWSF